jgi:hypothetical protein
MSIFGKDAIPSVEETVEIVKGMRKKLIQRIYKYVSPGYRTTQDEVEEFLQEAYPLALEVRRKALEGRGCFWKMFLVSFNRYLLGSTVPGSSWDPRVDDLPMLACPRINPSVYVDTERYFTRTVQNVERILSPQEILFFRLFTGLTEHGILNDYEAAKVMGVPRGHARMIRTRVEQKIALATKIHMEKEVIFVSQKQIKDFNKERVRQKNKESRNVWFTQYEA